MRDSYQREIDYMRISITDRCNLRCSYCMPDGVEWLPMEEVLTYEEIAAVCEEAAKLGIRKVKITGGEPFVRKGCAYLVEMIKGIAGIQQVTLTTNGVELKRYASALKRAGIDGINISLDTKQPEIFCKITGFDRIQEVLDGIDAAYEIGIPVKMNTVLQPGINEDAWKEMVEFARDRKIDVRFIEMMPIGNGKEISSISNEDVKKRLEQIYGSLERDTTVHGNGPAVYYRIPGFCGSIGFISAMHGKFCRSCNRIRMTATGELKPCLCYGESISIKEALRMRLPDGSYGIDYERLREKLETAILGKPQAHCFEEEQNITEKKKMAQIGG